jgi:antitoxin VapB
MGYGDDRDERLLSELRAIRERVGSLPLLDARGDDDIVGYDEHGLPT